MAQADVSTLRRFNREFTQRIGVLHERFLGRNRPLGPARLLFEVGPEGARVVDLRARLGLDSGYLSRLLRGLESEGLVAVERDPADRRRRIATLTSRGRVEWDELDFRSEELAVHLVSPLSESHRARLDEALTTAQRLLAAATATFDVVDPRSDHAIWAVARYCEELDRRFENGFDPGEALVASTPHFEAPRGAFVVVHAASEPVGCGGIQTLEDGVAEVKRMWVSEDYRGAGLGSRLLAELENGSRALGHGIVRLDTNSALAEAIALYRRAGYVEIEPYNLNPHADHWFEKRLDA